MPAGLSKAGGVVSSGGLVEGSGSVAVTKRDYIIQRAVGRQIR